MVKLSIAGYHGYRLQMMVDWLQWPKEGKSTIVVLGILAAEGLTFLALLPRGYAIAETCVAARSLAGGEKPGWIILLGDFEA